MKKQTKTYIKHTLMIILAILFIGTIMNNTHSQSMGNEFAALDKIFADETYPFDSIQKGDVICFDRPDEVCEAGMCIPLFWIGSPEFVCHRVFTKTCDGSTRVLGTWGDANILPDRIAIDRTRYAGKVRWSLQRPVNHTEQLPPDDWCWR